MGSYNVRVDASGFQSTVTNDLQLQVDEARELDFTLTPATVVTTVTVAGNAVAIETTNPSLWQVITSEQVAQLPLNGRDFVQLATLTAGATAETNPGSYFTSNAASEVAARGSYSLSVGGSRPNSTDWLLDGVDNNELTAGGIGIFSSSEGRARQSSSTKGRIIFHRRPGSQKCNASLPSFPPPLGGWFRENASLREYACWMTQCKSRWGGKSTQFLLSAQDVSSPPHAFRKKREAWKSGA